MAHFHRLLSLIFIFSIVHYYSANPSKLSTLLGPPYQLSFADSNPNLNTTPLRFGDGPFIGKSSGLRDAKVGKNSTGDEESTDSSTKEETGKTENVPPSSTVLFRVDRLSAPRISTVNHKIDDNGPGELLGRADNGSTTAATTPKSGADYGRNSFPVLIIGLLLPMIGWIFVY